MDDPVERVAKALFADSHKYVHEAATDRAWRDAAPLYKGMFVRTAQVAIKALAETQPALHVEE